MKSLPLAIRLRRIWGRLRSTYWFIPGLIIGGLVGLSYVMLTLDKVFPTSYIVHLNWVYTRDPAGARALLSAISESMITVAGVVFSITVVALSLASNQFGPRVLQSFERDTGNQIALGTLLGTFLYGILVMRRVESGPQYRFVPSISVAVGILLAMVSVAVLVYFIHHVIVSIQAQNVIAAVADDLYASITVIFPEEMGEDVRPEHETLAADEAAMMKRAGEVVRSGREGYVASVHDDKLMHAAGDYDAVVRLLAMPGDFVRIDSVLARIWTAGEISKPLREQVQSAIAIDVRRTYEDDIGFGLQQLSLICVRSLSPALNAIGTAMDSLERLFASLVRLGNRKIPSPYRRDEDGRLRVVTNAWRFDLLLEGVFGPIRHAAAGNPTVVAHILQGLTHVQSRIKNLELRRIVCEHIERFADEIEDFPREADRRRVREMYRDWRAREAA